ncbi:DUF3592 domain-containing protein [Streptomyces sp. NPDC001250]|uniref:DUF3592 domain-containing protein n=1 Tax=Streptomyces sp. NPDC001250 TaxID=3154382 RepID=UPI00332E5432
MIRRSGSRVIWCCSRSSGCCGSSTSGTRRAGRNGKGGRCRTELRARCCVLRRPRRFSASRGGRRLWCGGFGGTAFTREASWSTTRRSSRTTGTSGCRCIAFHDQQGHRVEFSPRMRGTGVGLETGRGVPVLYEGRRPQTARVQMWRYMMGTAVSLLLGGMAFIGAGALIGSDHFIQAAAHGAAASGPDRFS